MKKTVIFDMYGVIVEDPHGMLMPFIWHHFPHLTEDMVYAEWEKANAGAMSSHALLRELGFAGDVEASEKAYLDAIALNRDFFSAAEALRGTYRLALLSNDIAEWSEYLRSRHDLNRWFDAIVVSGDVALRKPDQAIFALLLDRLGARAQDCFFVDDRCANLDTARAMGMTAIRFGQAPYDGPCARTFSELTALLLP